jgi:hypothetical protein
VTRDEYTAELRWLMKDPDVESAFDQLLRQERLSFAAEYDLPALRLDQPFIGEVTTDDWLYSLPFSYQKNVFKSRNSNPQEHWFRPIYRDIGAIDARDFDHNDIGPYVECIAIADRHMAIYPKANDTIYTWFYRKPDVDEDITEIPDEWISRVLTPRIVLRCYRLYPDLARENMTENRASLDWWRTQLHEGLFGSQATGLTGWINVIQKSKPPRMRGGRQPLP